MRKADELMTIWIAIGGACVFLGLLGLLVAHLAKRQARERMIEPERPYPISFDPPPTGITGRPHRPHVPGTSVQGKPRPGRNYEPSRQASQASDDGGTSAMLMYVALSDSGGGGHSSGGGESSGSSCSSASSCSSSSSCGGSSGCGGDGGGGD